VTTTPEDPLLPSLLGNVEHLYRMRPANFAVSFGMQALIICALILAAIYVPQIPPANPGAGLHFDDLIAPFIPSNARGGGSGGTHEKLPASKGVPPIMNRNEQITPLEVVITNPNPQLPIPPSVLATSVMRPKLGTLGDPLSRATAPSNGMGGPSGIGSKCCNGVGDHYGIGVGDNEGNIYSPGHGGVTQPRAVYDPDPEYSDEARRAKFQGSVILAMIVGADGKPHDLKVQRSAGMGLDEKAMAAVNQWRFQPATLDGHPVAVRVSVEVSFRLF
jgi:periplasmic protein TonB